MALSPRALRSFFPNLPDEVLERIFGFGFHLWLREPWSFLCRSPSEPPLTVEMLRHGLMDLESERVILQRLCDESQHDGNVRGFRLVRGGRELTVVPLAWRTLSVVSPRAVAGDVVLDRASGLAWRPDGWKRYMCGMLEGLCDIDHAARPIASPYLTLSLRGEHAPILGTSFGAYRPETPEKWLFEGPWAKFYYHVSDNPSEISFSSVGEDGWDDEDRLARGAVLESDSAGDAV